MLYDGDGQPGPWRGVGSVHRVVYSGVQSCTLMYSCTQGSLETVPGTGSVAEKNKCSSNGLDYLL